MDNKEFSKQLEKRTKHFAIEIIRLSSKLPKTPEGIVVKTQVTKSGTSVGSNYREANRSRSRADFKNRVRICESEASETQYWLEIIVGVKWLDWVEIKGSHDESSQLLALFTSIGKNT